MRLTRLSAIAIAACAAGLVGLFATGLTALTQMRAKQDEVADLVTLQERIDDFSVASDSMLLFPADEALWRAYRADARDLQARLRALGDAHPDARKAAHQIELIVQSLARERGREPVIGRGPDGGVALGAVVIPERARIVLHQVASHGIALDTALDDVLHGRQQTISRTATLIAGGFAGSAALFGALCVIAFALIHRRITRPVAELHDTIHQARTGGAHVRADVRGDDEVAELAAEFNRLVEARAAADAGARESHAALAHRERMLAQSQQIAHIGSWRLHLADLSLEWSEETYRIVGVDPQRFTPTPEAFFERVHPDDRPGLRARQQAVLAGETLHDHEFRVVRPDGAVRRVHERAEAQTTPGGATVLDGTIQDVTEARLRDERLQNYRRLIEASSDLFCIISADYVFRAMNEAYAALFDLAPSELEGRPVHEVVSTPFFEAEVRDRVDRCIAGETLRFEVERDYPGAGPREFLIRYYPLEAPDGHVDAGVVMTDITEIRAAQRELAEQSRLVELAGRMARVGGWSVELDDGAVRWSNVVAEIHGMPHGYAPSIDDGIGFYAPEYRDRARRIFEQCAREGRSFDEELQVVAASGARVWVRNVGEPVHDDDGNIVRVQGAFQDITAQKAADAALERMAERLRNILESITDAFFTLDTQWCFDYVNSEAERLLERSAGDLVGRHVWTEFPEAVGTAIEHEYRRAMRDRVTVALEEYYPPLGRWFDIRAYPSEEGLAVYFRDVSERRALLEQLRSQERELRASRDELAAAFETRQALIDALPAHIALLDTDGRVIDVNDQWRHYGREHGSTDPNFGVGASYLAICDDAEGQCAEEASEVAEGLRAVLAGEQESFTLEYPCHSPCEHQWFRVMAQGLAASRASDRAGAVVMHVDVTERKLAERELNRIAYEDTLTGLYSRAGLTQAIDARLATEEWPAGASLALVDIAKLRDVNDVYGFAAGDDLLRTVAKRLWDSAGEQAVVARIAGDEFAVFLPEESVRSGQQQRDALAAAFRQPFPVGGQSLEVTARFGYTTLDAQPRAAEELLREAELALFEARESMDAGGWWPYSAALDEMSRERVQVTHELHKAIANEEFELHYHPKVRLASGEMVACEGLIRWNHPERGLQSPGTFIPIAERSQLIAPIGDWAIREACRRIREWQDAGLDIVRVAVNVSVVQFAVGELAATVRDALDAHGVAPSALTLEITESVFSQESSHIRRQLGHLHEMGVRLSLDDFGTGYSSLLYLQQYPFDEIKIDQGFVRHILDDAYSRSIVETVVALADLLGAEIVAEGVETAAVRDALLAAGCEIGQGFHYAMPLAAEDFRWLLERGVPLPIGGPMAASSASSNRGRDRR